MKNFWLGMVIAVGVGMASTSQAIMYSFVNITDDVTAATDVADQVFVDVTDAGGGKTLFSFSTVAGQVGTVSAVAFADYNDPSLLSDYEILDADYDSTEYAGVDFKASNGPQIGVLEIDFEYKEDGGCANGINIGTTETLGIRFTADFSAVIASMDAGSMQLGIHSQQTDNPGGSQKAVSNGRVTLPDGGQTVMLLGMALMLIGSSKGGCVGWRRR